MGVVMGGRFRRVADAPTWVLVLATIAVLAVVVGGVFVWDAFRAPAKAAEVCREEVVARLKAPSTAEFTGEVVEEAAGENEYRVTGAVDSENGFGAMIRNTYTCKVREVTDGWWRAYAVTFDED